MLRQLLLVSMMVVTITVACGTIDPFTVVEELLEPETTTYTNSEFGYSITLIDPFTVVEELNEKAEIRIGTSEGIVVQLIVLTGAEPLETDQLDEKIKRLNEMSESKLPYGTEFSVVSRADLTLGSGQIARITSRSATVPSGCERQEYRLNIIHEGQFFDIWAMPCADGSKIKDIKTIINSISLFASSFGTRFPNQGQQHIARGDEHPPYNSVPATSGWHYQDYNAPAPWGVHAEFIKDEVLIHNLEHGGVGIHYSCEGGCPELVSKLEDIANKVTEIILSPYPNMSTTIAVNAWNYQDAFNEFDEDRIEKFVRAHVNSHNAPEWQAQ